MTDAIDWQALIQKHLDGQTSGEEADALSEQIGNNDAVRSDYLKAARLHGALGDETLELEETIPSLKRNRRRIAAFNPLPGLGNSLPPSSPGFSWDSRGLAWSGP